MCVCVVYIISIKKSTAAAEVLACVRRRCRGGGGRETDISIAKGFDNQKGPAAAVTARRIRSFRNANLWMRHRRQRDDIAAPADCRVSDGGDGRGGEALWKSSSGKSREK